MSEEKGDILRDTATHLKTMTPSEQLPPVSTISNSSFLWDPDVDGDMVNMPLAPQVSTCWEGGVGLVGTSRKGGGGCNCHPRY